MNSPRLKARQLFTFYILAAALSRIPSASAADASAPEYLSEYVGQVRDPSKAYLMMTSEN